MDMKSGHLGEGPLFVVHPNLLPTWYLFLFMSLKYLKVDITIIKSGKPITAQLTSNV